MKLVSVWLCLKFILATDRSFTPPLYAYLHPHLTNLGPYQKIYLSTQMQGDA